MRKSLPLANVYQLIEPGPVVFLTTRAKDGTPNVMTMSWHMMMEFEPPLIGALVSNGDHSFKALNKTHECVVAVPSAELADEVVQVGNCSGRDVDKFKKFGLTQVAAKHVAAPLISECFANLECKVVDRSLVTRYNFFVLEVVAAWRDTKQKNPKTLHHCGYGRFTVDGRTIVKPSRMR